MKVLLQAAAVCLLRWAWEGKALVGRSSFVSRLCQYLFRNMLDRGSFDFRVIGGSGRREEDPARSVGSELGAGGVKTDLVTAMFVKIFAKVPYLQHYYDTGSLDKES